MRKAKGRGFPDKQLKTIAQTLVERLLPYFIDEEYRCPEIRIAEADGTGKIVLLRNHVTRTTASLRAQKIRGGTIATP